MSRPAVVSACPPPELLRLHARGRLPEVEADAIDSHFGDCNSCATAYDSHQSSVINALRDAGSDPKPVAEDIPEPLLQRVRGLIDGPMPKLDTICDAAGASSVVSGNPPSARSDGRLVALLRPPQGPDELGRLGRYRVLKVLGRGGMGAVFTAHDPRLDRVIALKVILPSDRGWDQAQKQRFLREARAAAAVHHDNVVPVFDSGEDAGVPYLAMPLLKGETLAELLKKEPTPPLPVVLQVAREICEGLAAAHEAGLIHRDLKPENVWLEEHGNGFRVRLLDFGLAAPLKAADPLTESGAVMGTPHYMSPEQARGEPVDPRTDLFSLGCILYQMCTGGRPFVGKTIAAILHAVLSHDVPLVRSAQPDLPAWLADLIDRLLRKNPAERPPGVSAVLERLGSQDEASKTPTLPLGRPATRSLRSGRRFTVALSAAALIFLAAAVVVYRIQTDAGELVIESDDPNIEVSIMQDGKVVKVVDLRTGQTVRLQSGEYSVGALKAGNSVRISPRQFALSRDGQVVVSIRQSPPAPSARPAVEPTHGDSLHKLIVEVGNCLKRMPGPPKTTGKGITFDLGDGIKMEMVRIEAKGKSFVMGSPPDEKGRGIYETQHIVKFGHDYYLGVYEVTQQQWRHVMGATDPIFRRDDNPVEKISWNDAKTFVNLLNEKFKGRGMTFRLPSEAEWEYACRAGTSTAFNFGPALDGTQANCDGSEPYGTAVKGPNLRKTMPVGSYKPNAFGLYDMHGNVYECCEDFFGDYAKAPTDGTAQRADPVGDNQRVTRGGTWQYGGAECRSANRGAEPPGRRSPNIGLRVAMTAE